MDAQQIAGLGPQLTEFLSGFGDCFGRSEARDHLRTYVAGQLSDLPRKSIEPMALNGGTPPRTLQRFIESIRWDEQRLCDKQQRLVAREHAHPQAIGVIDDSGNPKKGRHTAAVQHQWCGNTGKVDHCVVGVHLGYVAEDFQCLLDSDLFLPEDWANDPVRRAAAFIPEEVVYRKKTAIALGQVRRALANGIRVEAWTFDEFYGRDGEFLEGLEALGQNYVGEVPVSFTGWVHEPRVLLRPTPQESKKRGKKRRFPRLAKKSASPSEVRDLAAHSPVFWKQKWPRFHIKDGEKGPMVWEVKCAPFFRKRCDGLPGPAGCLIVARNVLNPDEVKYFVSNLCPGSGDVTLEWLLWVGFSRWPIERCFEQAKNELGMDHFEVRGWRSIHRHLYLTQLSHLFCARVHQRLREKNDGHALPDGRTSPNGRLDVRRSPTAASQGTPKGLRKSRRRHRLSPTPQPTSPTIAYQNHQTPPARTRHQTPETHLLCAA